MKAKELMIGDWVMNPLGLKATVQAIRYFRRDENDDNSNYHIIQLRLGEKSYQYLEEKDILPIPLTDEILERNGFEYHEGERGLYGVGVSPYYAIEGSPYIFCDGHPFAVWFEDEVTIKYVHQLQHVLRLCGLREEIKMEG